MAKREHVSETPATQLLKAHKVAYTEHPYEYLEHGGAQHSAAVLGLDPFMVVKTLIMQDQDAKPLVVLMHGKNFCAGTWDGTIRALSASGYRVIAPDQIGFCKSTNQII